MSDCSNCAGTGTTVIAVIALILVIILIILVLVFFFFPSNDALLQVRGTNFIIVNGSVTGVTGSTDTLNTGANNLYISPVLTSDVTLNINPSPNNFVGMTIGVKNTTTPGTGAGSITLVGTNGLIIDPGGSTSPVVVGPGEFAWLVCTNITSGSQRFLLLIDTT